MAKDELAEDLARELVEARYRLRRAAQVLHDQVGSLLAVAGLRLQLLKMDVPEASARASEVVEALDGVMECTRTLSRELEPSPVRRTGLKNAVTMLGEMTAEKHGVRIDVRYSASVVLEPETADAAYHAIASAIAAAVRNGAAAIRISITGARTLKAQVQSDDRRRAPGRELKLAGVIASHAGLAYGVVTEKGTIVSIDYAPRRSSRR